MNKSIILILLAVSCTSNSYHLKKQSPQPLGFCLDGSKYLHKIGIKEADLSLWRNNSVFDQQGLRPKAGLSASTSKRIEIIANNTKTSLSNSLPGEFSVQDREEFLQNYLGFCLADKVGRFTLDNSEYITIEDTKSGSYDREELENLYAAKTVLVKASIDQVVLAHERPEPNSDISIDLNHSVTFPISFTYTSSDGMTKMDAQKLRKNELAVFYKKVLFTIANLAQAKPIRDYLIKNTPLPPHQDRDFAEVKKKIFELLEEIDGVQPLSAHSDDQKIEIFGKELGQNLYADVFNYTEDSFIRNEASYNYRLNELLKSLPLRGDLFSMYLIWASQIKTERSKDGSTITFNVNVSLPDIFKRFKFEPISQHVENQ